MGGAPEFWGVKKSLDIIAFENAGDRIGIQINGRNLLEAVRAAEIEAGTAPEIAGGYLPLLADSLTTLDPEYHPFSRATWILLYVCHCGFPICSGLWVRSCRTATLVQWTGFASEPRHVLCNYRGVGPFRFDREQYVNALNATWNHLLQHGIEQKYTH